MLPLQIFFIKMVTINQIINNADIEQLLPEKRVAVFNISWQAYKQILTALGENRVARVQSNGSRIYLAMWHC